MRGRKMQSKRVARKDFVKSCLPNPVNLKPPKRGGWRM